jgi:hypothetical protein
MKPILTLMKHPGFGIPIKRNLRMVAMNMSVVKSFRMVNSVKRRQRIHPFVLFIKIKCSAESI